MLENDPLPTELHIPVAVSTHLLDPSASVAAEQTDDLSGSENTSTPPLNTPVVDSKVNLIYCYPDLQLDR